MDSEENSYTAINETYKIWKKHSPFLYNLLQVYELSSCSQTVQWFTDSYIENDWKITNLLIGSNSISQNCLKILSIGLPTDDSLADYSSYRQEKPQISIGANGYIGTIGLQQLNVKVSIPQASQIMKARINYLDQNLIAVKTGGANTEFIVYDLRNKQQELQNNSIKLEGHTQQGFGLAWNPIESSKLLSGSYDKKIIVYDINSPTTAELILENQECVQDVKWSNFNSKIFGSCDQNGKINLWDIRSGQNKPFISRKAHNGQIYSIDFNHKSEHMLISGGQDGDVCLWDIRNMNKKLHSFIGHNESVNVVSWNPNNLMQFASGSSDRRIVVWDIQKLNQNTPEKGGNQIFIHGGHRSKVTDVSWNKQKEIIASCEQNNILHTWKMNEHIQTEI